EWTIQHRLGLVVVWAKRALELVGASRATQRGVQRLAGTAPTQCRSVEVPAVHLVDVVITHVPDTQEEFMRQLVLNEAVPGLDVGAFEFSRPESPDVHGVGSDDGTLRNIGIRDQRDAARKGAERLPGAEIRRWHHVIRAEG